MQKLIIHAVCALALLVVATTARTQGQGQAIGPEVGVYQGQFNNGNIIVIAIDAGQNVGYISPRAEVACSQNVGLFIAEGKGVFDETGSVVAQVNGVCPDKIALGFRVAAFYDTVTDSITLSFPDFPAFPDTQLDRLRFNVGIVMNGIKELKNDFAWLLLDFIAKLAPEVPDQSCPPGEVATGITGGLLQCAEQQGPQYRSYAVHGGAVIPDSSPTTLNVGIYCDDEDTITSAGVNFGRSDPTYSENFSQPIEPTNFSRSGWFFAVLKGPTFGASAFSATALCLDTEPFASEPTKSVSCVVGPPVSTGRFVSCNF